ncbi:hypothetical protein STEG23_005342, partial [Scotinomys teguina]
LPGRESKQRYREKVESGETLRDARRTRCDGTQALHTRLIENLSKHNSVRSYLLFTLIEVAKGMAHHVNTEVAGSGQFIRDLVTAWVEKMVATCGAVSLPNKPS